MDELEQVRQGARAAWSGGDFSRFAGMLWESGGDLVRRLGIGPGDEVVDVGCGTGNLAIQAAQTGARVTGIDIAPPMLERARAGAQAAGVDVAWIEGDAEALPVADASMDVAMSSFGCMFAPRHRAAAAELARVLRPGGRMGLLSWTVGGDVAEFLRTASAHLPPPPAGAESPVLWGDPGHVHEVFEGLGMEIEVARGRIDFPYRTAREAFDIHAAEFGPMIAARALLEPLGRWQPLADDIAALFARREDADGVLHYGSDHLIVLGRRAG